MRGTCCIIIAQVVAGCEEIIKNQNQVAGQWTLFLKRYQRVCRWRHLLKVQIRTTILSIHKCMSVMVIHIYSSILRALIACIS
jgi:hypothetical protein